ncbi:MAG: complex I NDUFA9 subunit family protein [Casimicrobiaceae bacterium]
MKHKRIVVLGGAGFVGRHLVNLLAEREREVVVVTRARERAKSLFMLPRVEIRELDPRDSTALAIAARGADALINLVGILNPANEASFTGVHVGVLDSAIRACRSNGISRLLQLSSLNADAKGPSAYLRSKGEAEAKVVASGLAWTIFQPSVLFGPEDRFLNTAATVLKLMPVIFLPGAAARFQPLYVHDVVAAIAGALDDDGAIGERYPLCGPNVYTLRELWRYVATVIGVRRAIIGVPNSVGQAQAWVLEHLPGRMLTRDNLASMRVDSVCSCPWPARFGGPPRAMESVVPAYLSGASKLSRFSVYRRRHR